MQLCFTIIANFNRQNRTTKDLLDFKQAGNYNFVKNKKNLVKNRNFSQKSKF